MTTWSDSRTRRRATPSLRRTSSSIATARSPPRPRAWHPPPARWHGSGAPCGSRPPIWAPRTRADSCCRRSPPAAEAEPLHDPGEEARAAAAGADDEDQRAALRGGPAAPGRRCLLLLFRRRAHGSQLTRRSGAIRSEALRTLVCVPGMEMGSGLSAPSSRSPRRLPRRRRSSSSLSTWSCEPWSCPSIASYLPVPKAGWTTVLWLLSKLAGIPAETFEHSTLPGVSPALTVHDMGLWGPGRRLADYEGEGASGCSPRTGGCASRRPGSGPRLWSAAVEAPAPGAPVSLGLRERAVVSPHPAPSNGSGRGFPAVRPRRGGRRGGGRPWWSSTTSSTGSPSIMSAGSSRSTTRSRCSGRTFPTSSGPRRRGTRTGRRSPCRRAFDEAAAGALNRHYAADFEAYGYDRAEPADDEALAEWRERAAPLFRSCRRRSTATSASASSTAWRAACTRSRAGWRRAPPGAARTRAPRC